jgi:hypothetical protein
MLALSACASPPAAPPPVCPKLSPLPAWIVEPEPSLMPLLDRIISPSAPG